MKSSAKFATAASFIFLVLTVGCQSDVVQRGANKLAGTVPSLYYEQVLDNMARLADNPKILPYFGVPSQATHTNSRQMNAGYTGEIDLNAAKNWLFDKQTMPLSGSDQNQEALQVQPVVNPDKLLLMQAAYLQAMKIPSDPGDRNILDNFYKLPRGGLPTNYFTDYSKYLIPGWYCVTRSATEAKKKGCYCARGCGGWIYVPPEGMDGFTNFTLAILDIATVSDTLLYGTKSEGLVRKDFQPTPSPPVAPSL